MSRRSRRERRPQKLRRKRQSGRVSTRTEQHGDLAIDALFCELFRFSNCCARIGVICSAERRPDFVSEQIPVKRCLTSEKRSAVTPLREIHGGKKSNFLVANGKIDIVRNRVRHHRSLEGSLRLNQKGGGPGGVHS
jgi:hypothetical protein